jgi:predicted transcriptional regulator
VTPLEQWQIKEIELGIQEADAGELVSHATVVDNWKKRNFSYSEIPNN